MKKMICILVLTSVVLMSATSSMKKKLEGVWKIETMEIKGLKMHHQQLGLPYIEFNEEGGFLVKVSTSHEKGRYKVKGTTIKLRFLMPKKPVQTLMVTKLTDTELDYSTSDSTGTVKVVCYKVTGGINEEKD